MFEQIQRVPWGLIRLCLSGLFHMTFVMSGISHGGSRHMMSPYSHTLEKEMATHSSILAWRIPLTEESGGLHRGKLSPWGHKRVRHNWATKNTHTYNHLGRNASPFPLLQWLDSSASSIPMPSVPFIQLGHKHFQIQLYSLSHLATAIFPPLFWSIFLLWSSLLTPIHYSNQFDLSSALNQSQQPLTQRQLRTLLPNLVHTMLLATASFLELTSHDLPEHHSILLSLLTYDCSFFAFFMGFPWLLLLSLNIAVF